MVILVDSSAWIDYLRAAPTPATEYVDEHLGVDTAVCEPVHLEVLAGMRRGRHLDRVDAMLLSQPWCRVDAGLDYRAAVDVFHAARASGHPPRSLQDCLIAAIALRHGVALAHRDVDLERIAAATGLATIDLRTPETRGGGS